MLRLYAAGLLLCLNGAGAEVGLAQPSVATLRAEGIRLTIEADATVSLTAGDAADAPVLVPPSLALPIGSVTVAGVEHPATAARVAGDLLWLHYGESGVRVGLRAVERPRHVTLEVAEVEGPPVERVTIVDLLLQAGAEPHGMCALALNLRTDVPELPGPQSRPRAFCVPRFGLVGAKVALVGGAPEAMREALKEAVGEAPELPHSPVGGPWALEGPLNRSSYLFNFGGLTVATADEWIARAHSIGFDQIQFHGGASFRFGDCALDPVAYPNGFDDLRAVIDKLHAAGIKAGMQPYAFFIDKRSPWVTPKPDPRLAVSATFTLAEELTAEATTVPVTESTEAVSTITGFFVRNSVTLRIDDELIVFSGATKEPPYAFTQCQRGALGTAAAPHAKGAPVGQLKECFGLFVPDPETTLFGEVAAKTAELANRCGFDAIYLDALDGEDILGGVENSWHYGSAYAFEIASRLERPTVMEMSTFHHHLWFLRSRMGAWDHPNRCYKQFVDLHARGNESNTRMFLPSNLGWWAFKGWGGPQVEPTFTDDTDYICAKALGTDSGLSLVTYDPTSPGQQRQAEVMRRWEALRHSGAAPEPVKARLREPGAEFTLEDGPDGPRFVPVHYAGRTADLSAGPVTWEAAHPFAAQPVGLRIEALSSIAPYDDPAAVTLTDFADSSAFGLRDSATGVTVTLGATTDECAPGTSASGVLEASSTRGERKGSWARVGCAFPAPVDLTGRMGLGVWVCGDGKGELLNLQLRSPEHIASALAEHYVTVDFTGWRYFALVEPDAARWADHVWPYGGAYSIYREEVAPGAVSELSLWLNELPPGDSVRLLVSPVRALALPAGALADPSVSAGGRTIVFPTTLETGSYLEWRPGEPARLYGPDGAPLGEVAPTGEPPVVETGGTAVTVSCSSPAQPAPRARVTTITRGTPLE